MNDLRREHRRAGRRFRRRDAQLTRQEARLDEAHLRLAEAHCEDCRFGLQFPDSPCQRHQSPDSASSVDSAGLMSPDLADLDDVEFDPTLFDNYLLNLSLMDMFGENEPDEAESDGAELPTVYAIEVTHDDIDELDLSIDEDSQDEWKLRQELAVGAIGGIKMEPEE